MLNSSNKIFFKESEDIRGRHTKVYYDNGNEAPFKIKEVYMTTNHQNTIRGLHGSPNTQKLMKVVSGAFVVFKQDNKDTKAVGKIYNSTSEPILIKQNEFVGYLSLRDESVMLYMTDNIYEDTLEETRNIVSNSDIIDWLDIQISNHDRECIENGD